MMPAAVFVEAVDEVLGVLGPKFCCSEQHDIRLVAADSSEAETVGQVALPFQVRSRTRDKQAARVLVHVRALRIIT